MTWGQAGCAVIAVTIIILVFACSGGLERCSSVDTPRGPSLKVGGYARINGGALVAASEADLERVTKLSVAKDNEGIVLMLLEGRVWMAKQGTRCRVIDLGWSSCEVRLLDGTNALQSGFVAREFLDPE